MAATTLKVSEAVLVAVIGPSFVLVIGFMAWIVRELARISKATTVLEGRLNKSDAVVELRLRELEHWHEVSSGAAPASKPRRTRKAR
jgi:hypothetical protein